MPNYITPARRARTNKLCTNPNCTRSGQLLPLTEFHKDKQKVDGRISQCKQCCRARVTEYRKTEHGRKKKAAWCAEDKRKNGVTNKMLARYLVNKAISRGDLPRPISLPCSECGQSAKEYHHHLGYEPEHYMDVIPVCVLCHAKLHHQ